MCIRDRSGIAGAVQGERSGEVWRGGEAQADPEAGSEDVEGGSDEVLLLMGLGQAALGYWLRDVSGV